MKIFLFTIVFLTFPLNRLFFGVETISVYMNNDKIGFWNIYTKTPEKIVANLKSDSDTLFLSGYSDVGNLDGTIIKIKYKDSLVLTLTRVSKSGASRHDTVLTYPELGEKKTFFLDRYVTFKATKQTFRKLLNGRIYNVFIQRLIFEDKTETHIFDLQLK